MVDVPPDLRFAFASDLRILAQRSAQALDQLPSGAQALAEMTAEPTLQAVTDIVSCAHALAGTAGLLGLELVADPARSLEREAEAALRDLADLRAVAERAHARIAGFAASWAGLLLVAGRVGEVPSAPDVTSPAVPVAQFTFIDGEAVPEVEAAVSFTFTDRDDETASTPSPAIIPAATIDPAYIAAFRNEAEALLTVADEILVGIDEHPGSATAGPTLGTLMRAYHTLKGSANTVGLSDLGNALHDLEDRVEAFIQTATPLSAPALAALASVHEGLRVYLDGQPSAALVVIAAAVARVPVPDQSALPTPTTELPLVATQQASAELAAPDSAAVLPVSGDDTRDVRVTTGRLDRLLGLSGELVTARSRLGRRVDELGQVVRELARWRRRTVPEVKRLVQAIAHIAATPRQQTNSVAGGGPAPLAGAGPDLDRYDEAVVLARRFEEYDDRIAGIELDLRRLGRDTGAEAGTLGQLASQLHQEAAAVRMVPLAAMVARMRLAVREAADRLGRQVDFTADTAGLVVDIAAAEPLSTALLHLVRNAVDHGILPAAERLAAGRPAVGVVRLTAQQSGGALVVSVTDDGPGLDRAAIAARAAILGLPAGVANDPAELIFAPGFSTRGMVGEVSGRGIGLDAARAGLRAIGGELTVASTRGYGCIFTMRLPPQTVVSRLIVIVIGGRSLALPDAACERVESLREGQTVIVSGEVHLPVIAAGTLLGLPAEPPQAVVIIGVGGRRLALGVERISGREEAVVHPVGRLFESVPVIAGAVIPGDGVPVPVLDPMGLLDLAGQAAALPAADLSEHLPPASSRRQAPRVLLVDDSLAVRKVGERFLLDAGCEVVTAIDGTDALEQLRHSRQPFTAIISDLEMPRTNGYELLTAVRADTRAAQIPVAIMSSRRGEQHRQEAARLGADAYLTKPFSAADLADFVTTVTGRSMT